MGPFTAEPRPSINHATHRRDQRAILGRMLEPVPLRAPLTGIVLVIEMTSNYYTLILTCLTATIVAHTLGGRPICTVLLERTLAKCDAGA